MESHVVQDFEHLISQWETDHSLLEASQLSRRMDVLDQLDAHLPIAHSHSPDSELHRRATAISTRLESANRELYQSIRHEIQLGHCPAAFAKVLQQSTSNSQPPSIGYDYLDELITGVLQFDEPTDEPLHTGPENVFYQPTPARHIFAMIAAAAISSTDLFVDLGSGLGHVPLLVSLSTGARSIGIELEPSFISTASQCAQRLNLNRVTFLQEDAQHADLSKGTVFYLYSPFIGSILRTVLNSLQKQAAIRPIKICTFGPCTFTIAQEPWLNPMTTPETDQITVFSSYP